MPTRFYGRNSSYVHGGLDSSGKLAEAVYGQAVGAEILMNTLKMCIIYWKNTHMSDYLKGILLQNHICCYCCQCSVLILYFLHLLGDPQEGYVLAV